MIQDANSVPSGSELSCDVVIVGTGAAGIPCACELIDSGKSVIVLESGGRNLEARSQALTEGEVDQSTGHGSLTQFRKRVFGGTTSVWGGRCAPFDEIDFEKRNYVAHSGWPITRGELDPFYRKAHDYLLTGDFDYTAATTVDGGEKPVIPGLGDETWKQDRLWRFSLPANLGKEFGDRLDRATNVRTLLHANALQLRTDGSGDEIRAVEVGTLDGNRFTVKAGTVVLAAGGLEVTRLLLVSNDVHTNGLGNGGDQLGRYYMSHMSGDLGEVRFTPGAGRLRWEYQRARDGVYVKRYLRPSEEAQRREGLLNFRCILTHPAFADAGHGSGVLSAAYLAKRFFKGQIPPEYSKEMAAPGFHNVPQHLKNIILGSPGVVKFGLHWFLRRTLARRKYPSISLKSQSNCYTLHFDAEQSPNPDSRVLLSRERDVFGQPQVKVDWSYQDRDLQSVVRWKELLAENLKASGAGVFTKDPEQCRELIMRGFGVGSHHIGTTRMSDDERTGVVDRNCQVHGVRGLFVASPSVFPTGSFANPVLTTTALSIRLATHLKSLDKS